MKKPAGKGTSPLDRLRPEKWSAQLTRELLELIWVLEQTVELQPALNTNLKHVLDGPLFSESELPMPTLEETQAPKTEDDTPEHPDLFS